MHRLFLSLLLLILPSLALAQRPEADDPNLHRAALSGWHLQLGAGFNLGGTSPLPLPAEIRAIKGYNPCLNIALQAMVDKKLNAQWGLRTGLRFEQKAMRTNARVKNYYMEAVNNDGSGTIRGRWTGSVRTNVSNAYVSLPLLATFDISPRWQVGLGPYLSYALDRQFTGTAYDGYIRNLDPTGELSMIESADYDFSSSLRRWQWGLELVGQFRAYEHLALTAQLQWGLNGIFPTSFESVTFPLYPIYATIGFAYCFN